VRRGVQSAIPKPVLLASPPCRAIDLASAEAVGDGGIKAQQGPIDSHRERQKYMDAVLFLLP
jgi:hypothetical protein